MESLVIIVIIRMKLLVSIVMILAQVEGLQRQCFSMTSNHSNHTDGITSNHSNNTDGITTKHTDGITIGGGAAAAVLYPPARAHPY